MKNAIEVSHLSHSYGDFPALDDLTFDVNPGEVLGLLGPNGAGKTTTIRLINGLFPPSAGEINVMGYDPITQGKEVRKRTGVLTETPALYERLNARQNLRFFGTLAGMAPEGLTKRIDELLSYSELDTRANERVENYSKGMKQRLALARALIHHPALLFLDEPTSGLDPEAAQMVHSLIYSLRNLDGQTVVICTHHLHEAEELCDRMAILNHGRLLALGSLEELRQLSFPGTWVQIAFWNSSAEVYLDHLKSCAGVVETHLEKPDSIRVRVVEGAVIPTLVCELVAHKAQVFSVQPHQISLEEIYFGLQSEQREGES